MGRRQEHVVAVVHVDAAGQRLAAEQRPLGEVRVVLEQHQRHLRRAGLPDRHAMRSEEHTSELQSLMRISYALFCLKNKPNTQNNKHSVTPKKLLNKSTKHR